VQTERHSFLAVATSPREEKREKGTHVNHLLALSERGNGPTLSSDSRREGLGGGGGKEKGIFSNFVIATKGWVLS